MKSNPLTLKTISITEFCKPKCQETSKLEGNIAMFMSCHCAIMNCDHLVDLCKNTIHDSKIASKLKMHRTKCSAIIKNVLSTHFEDDLINDIGNGNFSLLLDESNDITVFKMLGVAIVYFSKRYNKVIYTYLCLIELDKCDSDSIVKALKNELMSK